MELKIAMMANDREPGEQGAEESHPHAFDKAFLRYNSVQLRIPLHDPVELRGFLDLILAELTTLHARLAQSSPTDRMALLEAQARIMVLNRKMNPPKGA